jgi:hypothetical protein
VSTYRKMRRQARQARRSGLQPMMVINNGEPFPDTVAVVLLRAAWRYRSELAPVAVTGGLVTAAWWLHATRPHWWLPVAVLAGVAAWAVVLFGARWRLPTLIERIYAAVTIYVAGVWLSAAIAVGPFLSPLLQSGESPHLSFLCRGGRTGGGARRCGLSASCKRGPILPKR